MSNTNYVFVIDTNKKPLQPCKPSVARRLLNQRRAGVWRRFPFTLILKKAVEIVTKTTLALKIDPGSKFTGMALVDGNKVIWMLEIQHRGSLISEKLQKRSQRRRARRTKNLRYRKPGNPNKKKPTGWLAPSVMHRVETTMTWVKRLIKFCPVQSISMELVRFDTQLIQNPEISGTEYQQGELAGYELKEYLLEGRGSSMRSHKWSNKYTARGRTYLPQIQRRFRPSI